MLGMFGPIVLVLVVGVCQQLGGGRHAIFACPGQLLLAREAAAMLPALIGIGAAAAVVLAGERPRKVLHDWHRQRNADQQRKVIRQ